MEKETNTQEVKESIVFFKSYFDTIEIYDDPQLKWECYFTIINYGLYGKKPLSTNKNVLALFNMAKPTMDCAHKRYKTAKENGKKGAEFGKLGGAPKGNQNARKKEQQTVKIKDIIANKSTSAYDNSLQIDLKTTPKQPLNDNANDNDNDNINININVNEDENLNDKETNMVLDKSKNEWICSKELSRISEKYFNSFPTRNSVLNPDKINQIDLSTIAIEQLIQRINESEFLLSCPNLGLEWCLINYNKIIDGYYATFKQTEPKTEFSQNVNRVSNSLKRIGEFLWLKKI